MYKNVDLFKCSSCGKVLGEHEVHTEYLDLLWGNQLGKLGGFVCTDCIINSNVDKLYHLSLDCDLIEEFVPRIPDSRAQDEEAFTPRVSLSESIDGALTAVPWGGSELENIFWEDGASLIRVYEFDIKDLNISNLLPPEYIFSKDMVRDSRITREYWALEPIKPSRSYLIEVKNYNERVCDTVRADDLIQAIYAERDEDNYFIWDNILLGSFVEVYETEYEIIPEEKRSGVFRLNHPIEIYGDEDDWIRNKCQLEMAIWHEYGNARTWVGIEKRNGVDFIIGEIDTRGYNEIHKDKMIDCLNLVIEEEGKIIKTSETDDIAS